MKKLSRPIASAMLLLFLFGLFFYMFFNEAYGATASAMENEMHPIGDVVENTVTTVTEEKHLSSVSSHYVPQYFEAYVEQTTAETLIKPTITDAIEEEPQKVDGDSISEQTEEPETAVETHPVDESDSWVNPNWTPEDGHLTRTGGVFRGPSGKETYYNLNMNLVIQYMRDLGFSEEEYPYWVRDDGVKMFGDYVMVAADLSIRPKGTILETSLGTAIVCDTGTFAQTNHMQVDIAVNW